MARTLPAAASAARTLPAAPGPRPPPTACAFNSVVTDCPRTIALASGIRVSEYPLGETCCCE